MTSTTRSAPSRISSNAPRLRVKTPVISGRRPVTAPTSSARSPSSRSNAEPTVPWPSSPMRKARAPPSDIAGGEVVVGLAAHDQPRVAVADEDDRRARHAVVRVRHRVAVGAGDGRDDDIAGAGLAQGGGGD